MLALKDDGTVWAWGNNNYGQLGNNIISVSSTPVQVKVRDNNYLTNIVAIDAGESHSIALKEDGTVGLSMMCYKNNENSSPSSRKALM